ncbi:MAG TPA: hypothetical protein VEK57_25570 [Thermoanaerobaculia bacterium]|nr:hypothetical protein [Thermoanaerobaculia bacterium]
MHDLLQNDVDVILERAREFENRGRFHLLRTAAEQYPAFNEPIDRVKAVWLIQALLSDIQDRHLPSRTASDIATRLASIVESSHDERDARRSALDALALVFLKTKQLTAPMDATIRAAFMFALKARDPQLSEFAAEALSGEGVLAQRSPGRTSIYSKFTQPVDRADFDSVIQQLRARAAAGTRISNAQAAHLVAPRSRKTERARGASRR